MLLIVTINLDQPNKHEYKFSFLRCMFPSIIIQGTLLIVLNTKMEALVAAVLDPSLPFTPYVENFAANSSIFFCKCSLK